MNKAKLKSYAPQARKDFIAAVTARANLLGLSEKAGKLDVAASQPQGDVTVIAGQAWPVIVHSQRQQLVARIEKDGFTQTMEAVAYTWFNRFVALRYMELHDYLGHGHRALSSLGGTLPDILSHAADLAEGAELPGLKPTLVVEMKLAGNRDSELYRLLLVAQCNALSNVMPFLFERIDDETELLLPDNLLRTDSVIAKLVTSIDESDWKEVEIIGWLYQFYISEKKDEVIGKVVKSEDIPAATQLFTPNWIVQYMVQNSVGRVWLMANPASNLKAQWPYYIEPSSQPPEVEDSINIVVRARIDEDGGSLNPESITLLDPACGSGHILVEAYDVLKAIYLERGFQPRSIPRLILEKNLFGLDIDDRAAQMAGFALLMKARADDRRLFHEPIKINVLSLQESTGLDAGELTRALQIAASANLQFTASDSINSQRDNTLFSDSTSQGTRAHITAWSTKVNPLREVITALITTFSNAKTVGSLLQIPPELYARLAMIGELLQSALQSGDLYAKAAAQDLLPLVSQANILGMQFDAVVANPPYMGGKFFSPTLKAHVCREFVGFDKDLFSAFIIRSLEFTKKSGNLGFMSPYVWMFISSYESFRNELISKATITSLVQLEYSGFDGATVPICTFSLSKAHFPGFSASFVRLSDFRGSEQQAPRTLEAINNKSCGWFYVAAPDRFKLISGSPIAYWASPSDFSAFLKKPLSEISKPQKGFDTGSNTSQYFRKFYEVDFSTLYLLGDDLSSKSWVPVNKGGEYRKWYGNRSDVVTFKDCGKSLYEIPGANIRNKSSYFKSGYTYTIVTSSSTSFRESYADSVFYQSAGTGVVENEVVRHGLLGFLNSCVSERLLRLLCPTLNFTVNDVAKLPVEVDSESAENVKKLIEIAKADWDNLEISWEFKGIAWVDNSLRDSTLSEAWRQWETESKFRFNQSKELEERNNRIFIEAYGLQGELAPEIPDSKITLTRADREKDCQRLVSYAIGCMMGRYSLDAPGLIYANSGNAGFDFSRYGRFNADTDGIVPLTDELWFEDDAASRIREFLLVVGGDERLAENTTWLAESLGTKAGENPDEAIRRYLADKFYKEHVQTYRKRPIYWLFSSGKQRAFQALVYLHRYHEGTLARMRAEYVVPLTGKIQSRIDMLQKDAAAAVSIAARNKLTKEVEKLKKKHVELLAYDEQLRHYADMRITLDLNDGVKVNYGRFGDLLAEVRAITGGGSDD